MLRIDHLVKTYAGDKAKKQKPAEGPATVFAVNDVTFEVKEGELFTLLGPSGCGKTTTLRSIAGLRSRTAAPSPSATGSCSPPATAGTSTCRPTSAAWAWSSSPTRSGRT